MKGIIIPFIDVSCIYTPTTSLLGRRWWVCVYMYSITQYYALQGIVLCMYIIFLKRKDLIFLIKNIVHHPHSSGWCTTMRVVYY